MQESNTTGERLAPIALPTPLVIFAWGVPLLWLLSMGRVVLDRVILRVQDPWVLPGRFEDFFCYWGRLKLLHTEAFHTAPDTRIFGSGWGYPAPAVFVYRFFYLFDPPGVVRPYRGYAVMVGLTLATLAWMAWRLTRAFTERGLRQGDAVWLSAVGALMSWPLFLTLQRGNIEMVLWIPLALSLYAFSQRRWMVSALLIGLTASFKLYPILLLALFLRDRRWKELVAGVLVAVTTTLAALAFVGPTLRSAAAHIGLGVKGFIDEHGAHINWKTEGYSHSLFHLLKMRLLHQTDLLQTLIPLYMLTVAAVMLIVFFGRVMWAPLLNQVMVLCISMIYLPATSYDYTLLVLLVPCAWLGLRVASAAHRGKILPGSLWAMGLFTVLLGPEFFLSKGPYLYSGSVKAVCLGVLLAIAVVYPFPEEGIGGREQPRSFKNSTAARLRNGTAAGTLRKSQ